MKNYKMVLAYDGTRYNGWQKQGNTKNTIQQKLEEALEKLCGAPVDVIGSGRTDAGAHAKGQVANCHMEIAMSPEALLLELNRRLPEDLGVLSVEEAPERFHSRHHAKQKKYLYRIWNSLIHPVFDRKFLFVSEAPLDLLEMQKAAKCLIGTHDFRAFCSNKRYKKSTVRTLFDIQIETCGNEVRILYTGNGFLYNMARILTGTLMEVGEGKRSAGTMPELLAQKDRERAGFTAPAQGLTLEQVLYEK